MGGTSELLRPPPASQPWPDLALEPAKATVLLQEPTKQRADREKEESEKGYGHLPESSRIPGSRTRSMRDTGACAPASVPRTVADKQSPQIWKRLNGNYFDQSSCRKRFREAERVQKTTSEVFPTGNNGWPNFWASRAILIGRKRPGPVIRWGLYICNLHKLTS